MDGCRHDDGTGHARADAHSVRNLIDMNADRNPLRETDPFESGIDAREELRAVRGVAGGYSMAHALDMPHQRRAAAQHMHLDRIARLDGGQLCFLEIALAGAGVAVD